MLSCSKNEFMTWMLFSFLGYISMQFLFNHSKHQHAVSFQPAWQLACILSIGLILQCFVWLLTLGSIAATSVCFLSVLVSSYILMHLLLSWVLMVLLLQFFICVFKIYLDQLKLLHLQFVSVLVVLARCASNS